MKRSASVVRLSCLLCALLPPTTSLADAARVTTLAQQLKTSTDERVRTQAALELGATADAAAVQPLCEALGDRSPKVRTVVATSLGKLGNAGALPCLEAAKVRETTASVKGPIEKSIALLTTVAADPVIPPPPPGPDTKYYVAIDVKNKTSRSAAEIEPLLRGAIQNRILGKKGFAVAPRGQTPAQGGKIVQAKRLKGFLLVATVEPPVYAGDRLTQVVRVSLWSYPDKALKGEFAPKLTQADTPKADVRSEDLLMKMCAENAVDSFVKVASSL